MIETAIAQFGLFSETDANVLRGAFGDVLNALRTTRFCDDVNQQTIAAIVVRLAAATPLRDHGGAIDRRAMAVEATFQFMQARGPACAA